MIESYPLYWPEGRKKTRSYNRESARFDTSFARARDNIVREIELLCGRYTKSNSIISTNVPLRRDGLPLAGHRVPDDTGVAVYFTYKGKQVCFACDRWKNIADNMQAIAKTIEALRGIARWGTGDMLEAAFRGFAALPDHTNARSWREVLGVAPTSPRNDVHSAYMRLRSEHHPDKGGNASRFAEVQAAWESAQRELSS